MENLIKVQSAIQQLENLTGLETKYKTSFFYLDNRTMYIECYCWHRAAAYKELLDTMKNVIIWFEGNSKLKILSTSKYSKQDE